MNYAKALWPVQILVAIAFLVLGLLKLSLNVDDLKAIMGLSEGMIWFIGLVEILGAIGLIAPALSGIRPGLVPLAAAGLALVGVLAFLYNLTRGQFGPSLLPLVLGLLAAYVAYGRWKIAPHLSRTMRPAV